MSAKQFLLMQPWLTTAQHGNYRRSATLRLKRFLRLCSALLVSGQISLMLPWSLVHECFLSGNYSRYLTQIGPSVRRKNAIGNEKLSS